MIKKDLLGAVGKPCLNPVINVILNSIKMKFGKESLMGNSIESFSKVKKDYINLLLVIKGILYVFC